MCTTHDQNVYGFYSAMNIVDQPCDVLPFWCDMHKTIFTVPTNCAFPLT